MARDVTIVPSINIKSEYDDNVEFTRTSVKEDVLTRINPALTLGYSTELLNLRSEFDIDILRYADETDYNTEHQQYNLNGGYKLLERYTLSGNLSYIKDTTLESELAETGLVDVRQDRERYNAGVGLSYQLSELSDMGVTYNHAETDYDWERNVDYDSDAISLSFNHRFNNQLDVFTVQPYYTGWDSEASETDNYGLSLGWVHPFSETLTLTAFVGARYTETEHTRIIWIWPPFFYDKAHEKDTGWGRVANINLRKTGETFSAAIGYDRNITYSSDGDPIERDKIHCSADRMITERMKVKFTGNLYFTKSEGQYNDRDTRHFNLRPSLSYRITENHAMSLNYSYSEHYEKNYADNRKKDRNRIWFTLRFRFPRKW